MEKKEFKIARRFENGKEILSDEEMLRIRGGVEEDRPKSRPKEIIDWTDDPIPPAPPTPEGCVGCPGWNGYRCTVGETC